MGMGKHNIWQVTLHTMFYRTLHPSILHTQHTASDASHHALWEYHVPRRPFFTHTQHMQATLYTMLYDTFHLSNFYAHSIWQVMLRTVLYVSIMHNTFHFLHTQHMAGDALHHALSHTALFHLSYTQHMTLMLHTMHYESIMHNSLNLLYREYMPFSIFHTHSIWHWCYAPCSMRVSCTAPSILYTNNLWQVTHRKMLYESTMHHHTLLFLHSQHMAGDARHHALYHTALFYYTHTEYGRWRSTPCSMRVSCTTPSIFHTRNIC